MKRRYVRRKERRELKHLTREKVIEYFIVELNGEEKYWDDYYSYEYSQEYEDFEKELREEERNDIYERDMATDDFRFRHCLGEYEGWSDYDYDNVW